MEPHTLVFRRAALFFGAMRIGLNLLPLLPGIGGTWHYVANLLDALAHHAPASSNEYVAFVTDASNDLVPHHAAFTRVRVPLDPALRPRRVLFENTQLPALVRAHRIDCMHHFFGTLPYFSATPSVVTVHDLMVFERPADFSAIKRTYLRVMERRAARHASVIAPVSASTADHLHRALGVDTQRMHVIPAAISTDFVPMRGPLLAQFCAQYRLPSAFWLFVAGSYPHKNHQTLLGAIAERKRIASTAWPLVIRGDLPADASPMIRELALDDHVIVVPRLNDEEMPLLYSAASALVFPSLFEGGGMPVMEAMSCGCPVVAADIPTTREFAGNAALMFDPTNVTSLVDAMTKCEGSAALRADLAAAGIAAASALRPTLAADACMSAYRAAVHV